MADEKWSKETFENGYTSGKVIGEPETDNSEWEVRRLEQGKLGGDLEEFFTQGVAPLLSPDYRIVELGPGRGSWTRALFSVITQGEIHTIDLQDIRPWVGDLISKHPNRLFINQVNIGEKQYECLAENYFDGFFSFGVFCHMNLTAIEEFLITLRKKLKKKAICIAQYSDWEKGLKYCETSPGNQYNENAFNILFSKYKFEFEMLRARSPMEKLHILIKKRLQSKYPEPEISSNQCFWVRNDKKTMGKLLKNAGYRIIKIDMGFFKRDSVAIFEPR